MHLSCCYSKFASIHIRKINWLQKSWVNANHLFKVAIKHQLKVFNVTNKDNRTMATDRIIAKRPNLIIKTFEHIHQL